MTYLPGDAYHGEFITSRFDTGAATDADSLPVATATKNGADDGSFTLTVAKIDTGRYKITGTIPVGYTAGDIVQVSVAATVNSVAGKGVVDAFVVVSGTVALSASERNAVADAMLIRDVAGVEATAGDHSLCYLVLAASESNTTANAGMLTVFRTDGLTEFVQKPITSDAAADPITGVQ